MIGEDDEDQQPDDEQPSAAEQETENVAEPAKVRRRARSITSKKNEKDEFYRQMFRSPLGRRVLWEILAEMHPFDPKIGASPSGFPDERATWMYLGEQMLGLRLFASWQQIEPEGVFLMQQENDPRFVKPTRKTR